MNRLLVRVSTGLSTAALIASSFVGPALALDVEISGNGANSDNTANVAVSNSTTVNQSNTANITNDVDVDADTGKNDANGNTGGDVSVKTGDATANVGVSNTANSNVANVSSCCPNDVNVTISGNGAKSDNDANVGVGNSTWVAQNNLALVKNDVDIDADSGKNDANRNTGGDVSITTGDAGTGTKGVVIANAVNKNVASVGAGLTGGGSLAVVISGNGYDSDNTANVGVLSSVIVFQNNIASISNDVDVDADTGKNDANANTGGDVSIDTGDATADVEISNLANFNAADVDSCGCILDGTVKIKNNGAKSDNDANVTLLDATFVTQDNLYSCGRLPLGLIASGVPENGQKKQKPCNDVDVDLDTGKNDANRNTQGGEPEVLTGDAAADILVETTANSNVVGDVGSDWGFPELPDNSNGSSVSLVLLWLLAHFS